jgi:hypothetical protein
MADFNIRSDSVDVEQIMKQIRTRIKEKRGVDYTEDQIREIAAVRLEKFLDPKALRSDLLEQFRRSRPAIPPEPPPVEAPYEFTDETLFATHRGPLRAIRKLLLPLLKLFFNPNKLNQILHTQAQFNLDLLKREQRRKIEFDRSRADWNALYYEVLHNLVLETTRNGIELKNLKMRVEALTSRLDFSERRVRALEGVVQYRPEVVRPRPLREGQPQGRLGAAVGRDAETAAYEPAQPVEAPVATPATAAAAGAAPAGESPGRRRRRRRRGRRGAGALTGGTPVAATETAADGAGADEFDSDESDASEELAAIGSDDAGGDDMAADEGTADEENGEELSPIDEALGVEREHDAPIATGAQAEASATPAADDDAAEPEAPGEPDPERQ